MKRTLSESIRMILKEWDSSKILDAAFEASELTGEEPEWEDIIGKMIDCVSKANIKKIMKDEGYETEDEFYDSLYESDPDSVISYLEKYLSKKDINDIVSNFPTEEDFEDEEE